MPTFRLQTLFAVVTGVCVLLAVIVNRAERQRRAVAAIRSCGGQIEFARWDDVPTMQRLAEPILGGVAGEDRFGMVLEVDFHNTRLTPTHLAILHEFPLLHRERTSATRACAISGDCRG